MIALSSAWEKCLKLADLTGYFLYGLAIPFMAVWLSLGAYALMVGAGVLFLLLFWDTLLFLGLSVLFWLLGSKKQETASHPAPKKISIPRIFAFVAGVCVGAVPFIEFWQR
ncbi:hypothetical protein [Leisingera sp. ANG-DT]|uniref:hypothetical protein n=1 Tax=Leisingera sp. ANG-DT TaxID=1577897 RepID=UPI00057C5ABA|nr:hypothetical protein [Leisingera sp. ANG-DT]KIC17074.1 hypothetical protein RA21_10500 [Leisingera sp. ANG-DT]